MDFRRLTRACVEKARLQWLCFRAATMDIRSEQIYALGMSEKMASLIPPITRRATLGGAAAMALVGGWEGKSMAGEMMSETGTIAGWDALVDTIRTLPAKMLAKLPEAQRSDPQVQQEVARLAMAAIASQMLSTLGGDGDHPQFMPAIGQVLNVGQPNADTIYRSASITPGGTYRLRGYQGNLRMAVISEVSPRPKGATQSAGHRAVHDINRLPTDKLGGFDVLLSAERPAGHKGNWWQIAPTTHMLMMRLVSCDWSGEKSPRFSLERVDVSPQRPRPSAASLEARLRALSPAINFIGPMFVDHHEQLRREGFINALKVMDIASAGGLIGQFYYEGAYDLADDEALIVEAKAPLRCGYRSIILTNELYETTDWFNNHASLNDAQAPLDKDGVLRIVVSAQDPGVPNWLDTSGYRRGVIQGRWTDCDSQPVPTARKAKLSEVRKSLPAETPQITPGQRDHIIRTRRAALQQRPLW